MNSTNLINTSNKSVKNRRKNFSDQLRRVAIAFYEQPRTRFEVAQLCGVYRANVCRYVARLQRLNQIKVVRRGICPITKESGVEFLSTNPKFW